jgi:hypothetical protein
MDLCGLEGPLRKRSTKLENCYFDLRNVPDSAGTVLFYFE